MDITELDELLSLQLSPHDLAQCVRVCKKWYDVFVPHLWEDLSCLHNSPTLQQQAFANLVLEDYLHEQQHQAARGHGQHYARSSRTPPPRQLENYSPWIRHLPSPISLLYIFLHTVRDPSQLRLLLKGLALRGLAPTAVDLMRYLYQQCPNLHIQHLALHRSDLVESDDFLRVIAEYVAPRTQSLHLGMPFCPSDIPSWRLKYLLSHCSSALEELTLEIKVSYSEKEREQEYEMAEPTPWVQLKRLKLLQCHDKSSFYSREFWPWLWRRCGQVEQLEVDDITKICKSLAIGMLTHMPHLTKIHIAGALECEDIQELLSRVRHGWKDVSMGRKVFLTQSTMDTLLDHHATLERLVLRGNFGLSDNEKVQFLACCPKLRDFADFDTGTPNEPMMSMTGLDAFSFIDQDPRTGALKPWKCEPSLKALRLVILGIPRPDLYRNEAIQEAYDDQGREIQKLVYDRLARLTHLETLWLGGKYSRRLPYECLEMSLESGLYELAGLKALKKLNVSRMKTQIGLQEVQWMTEHWPKLQVIAGLQEKGPGKEAIEWLLENHPEIHLE